MRGGKVIGKRLKRPEHYIAVAVVRRERILVKHEPLGPFALRVLVTEHSGKDFLYRREMSESKEELHGTLANVAGTPCGAARLFQSVGGSVMNKTVVRVPTQDKVEFRGVFVVGADVRLKQKTVVEIKEKLFFLCKIRKFGFCGLFLVACYRHAERVAA